MTDTTAPLAAPRDIQGNEGATFVRCPDCSAAIFNLRHQRQKHLAWHDDHTAELDDLHERIGELTQAVRALGAAPSPATLVAEWPADEITARTAPTEQQAHAGEPAESAADDLDPDYVESPRRF